MRYMHPKSVLKTVCIVLGVIFLFSILTVESHAHDRGGLIAKLPTIIDGTVEYAVAVNDKVDLDVFRAIQYLPRSAGMFFIHRATTPPQIYRAPPPNLFLA